VIGQTSGKPALVEGMPIRDNSGNIVGVGMFASELSRIAEQVRASRVGNTGSVFVVDDQDLVVVHSDPTFPTTELKSLGSYPPVVALRRGTRKWMPFKDESNKQWRAYVDVLSNGWGVVVQQPEDELLSSLRLFQMISWTTLTIGTVLLLILIWLTIRQTLRPIGSLTEVVTAIARGDLTRTAPVESQDEIGDLAHTFNTMTVQLRELIGGLEQRVTERTRDLELRSNYLEAAAEVGRAASSILETDRLINQVVGLIRDQFKLYYVGLFLVDESGNEAVLRSGMGAGSARDAGRAMLARGHRLRIGGGSMIGWSIANALPRVASDADADAVRLATPELPDTRSEAAIPLRSRGRVLGALTVQSDQPAAFDETAIAALETMADQVATALDNARLFAESQAALEATRRVYGDMNRQAWQNLLGDQPELRQAYRSNELGVTAAGGIWQPEMEQAVRTGQIVQAEGARDKGDHKARHLLAVPLKVRGSVIGVLGTYKPGEAGEWTLEEIALVETLAEQLDLALDSARLYQDTQRRAAREQLIGAVTARMRESLDVDRVLQIAVREFGETLGAAEVKIRLTADDRLSTAHG
jgi:GAF domain-containing protein